MKPEKKRDLWNSEKISYLPEKWFDWKTANPDRLFIKRGSNWSGIYAA